MIDIEIYPLVKKSTNYLETAQFNNVNYTQYLCNCKVVKHNNPACFDIKLLLCLNQLLISRLFCVIKHLSNFPFTPNLIKNKFSGSFCPGSEYSGAKKPAHAPRKSPGHLQIYKTFILYQKSSGNHAGTAASKHIDAIITVSSGNCRSGIPDWQFPAWKSAHLRPAAHL